MTSLSRDTRALHDRCTKERVELLTMRHVPIVNAAVACCFICLAAGAVLSAAERTGELEQSDAA